MINLRFLSTNKLLLSVALFLVINNALAEEITENGVTGASGANSNGGDRGKNGGVGGDANAVSITNDLIRNITAVGGQGGNGGGGVDGDTVKSFNGGHGGVGGGANAIVNSSDVIIGGEVVVNATAKAGVGGNGGSAGGINRSRQPFRIFGTNGNGAKGGDALARAVVNTKNSVSVNAISRAIGGLGGSAGSAGLDAVAGNSDDGGSAFASATAIGSTELKDVGSNIIKVQAEALGGNGGQGAGQKSSNFPFGRGVAGSGGIAKAVARAVNTTGSVDVSARIDGGNGGVGSFTGRSGNGADADLIDAVSGSAAENMKLSQLAVAGDAGRSWPRGDGGVVVGVAGNAVSSFALSNLSARQVEGISRAIAGDGGLANAANATNGGSAIATINLKTSSDNVVINAQAFGGAGGDYINMGSGGNGGNASLGEIGSVYGQSTTGGDVSVAGVAQGGNGGRKIITDFNELIGIAGNGAVVNLNNSVNGDTSGSLFLIQSAVGGNSGDGSNSRFAGAANSVLSKSSSSKKLELFTQARGGSGGRTSAGKASDGANSLSRVRGENDAGVLIVRGESRGGSGGSTFSRTLNIAGGRGGDAQNIANGRSFDNSESSILTVRGTAFGGRGGFDNSGTQLSKRGDGGHAVSESEGSGLGGQVNINDKAVGGDGGNGGNAISKAIGRYNGEVNVISLSVSSSAEGGSGISRAGNAISSAFAESSGFVVASSVSRAKLINSGLVSGRADASAVAISSSGSSISEAIIELKNNVLPAVSARANTSFSGGQNVGDIAAISRTDASASVGNILPDFSRAEGMQAAAFATLLPNQAKANALINGNINVEADMAKKELLSVGLLGASYSENGFGVSQNNSLISLIADMSGKTNTDLIMGLFDSTITGDHGFDTLNFSINIERLLVENITFNDLETAEIYFNDNVLNFGRWGELISEDNLLNINISLRITEQHLGQGFSTQFATAASTAVVPIPTAIWLFGSGMLGLLTFVRRRK